MRILPTLHTKGDMVLKFQKLTVFYLATAMLQVEKMCVLYFIINVQLLIMIYQSMMKISRSTFLGLSSSLYPYFQFDCLGISGIDFW